eukprot:6996060-Pyramimonas_sp.AAC.1
MRVRGGPGGAGAGDLRPGPAGARGDVPHERDNEQQADVGPDAVRQKLTAALRNLTTRAIIFANGRDALIEPGVEGMVLNAATGGTPVVTVQTCYVGVTGKIVSTHEPRVLTLAHLQHPST